MGKLNRINNILLLSSLALVVSACAAGHCRGRKPSSEKKVFVFKPDGSKQCDKKSGTPIEKMADELNGIEVLSKENKADGMMHITLCGSPTGKINVFEVYERDLDKMKSLGYKELNK